MPLTADQLFTPQQSGVVPNPAHVPEDGTWYASLLALAAILDLPTTAWQAGGPERTILAMTSVALGREDAIISLMSQGGFLDFAASGTVTTIAVNGQSVTVPVTPDPSNPAENPTGALGWLDALGQSFLDEERLLATYAVGQLALVNTSAFTVTEPSGGYHASNSYTGATYTNPAALSVPPSAIAGSGGVITGIVIGPSTAITTSSAHGLSVGQVVYLTGAIGVTGLSNVFASVASVPTSTSFTVSVASAGAWTSGGTVYLCTVANMASDIQGLAGNAAPGAVTTPITTATGVSIYNLAAWSAANFESNVAYVARLRLKFGAASPNGPSQAYDYFALTAQRILAAQSPAITLTNGPIVKSTTYSNPQTQTVTCVVSSSTPASLVLGAQVTPGCTQLPVSNATNATPIVVTSGAPHGLTTGDNVITSGVLGNTGANGAFTIVVTGASTFQLVGSVGTGAYTGGGTINGGDLGEVDALLQSRCVPDGTDATTESSVSFPITIVATAVVPAAFAATYAAAASRTLVALLASYPVGGNIPPGGANGTIPYTAVEGALTEAGVIVFGATSYVRQLTSLTVNGGIVDVNYPTPNHDAQLVAPTINVVGV